MLDSILGGLQDWLGDTLTSMLEAILSATIFKLLYYAEIAVCWIINQLYSMFEVFAGIVRVSYDGEPDYLINVFFKNGVVTNIYWAMALIGIAITFGFAIWAVVKKMFDIDGRQQQSMGQIVGAGLKSIFLIISLTLVINVVLVMTNQLMKLKAFDISTRTTSTIIATTRGKAPSLWQSAKKKSRVNSREMAELA